MPSGCIDPPLAYVCTCTCFHHVIRTRMRTRRCTCVSAHAASSMRVHGVLRIFVVALSFATGVAFAFPPSKRTAQLVRRGSAPHPRPRAVPVVAQFSIWRHPANWLGPETPDRHTLKMRELKRRNAEQAKQAKQAARQEFYASSASVLVWLVTLRVCDNLHLFPSILHPL